MISSIVNAVMKTILEQFKQILVTVVAIAYIVPAIAQVKHSATPTVQHPAKSRQHVAFYQIVKDANVVFDYPKGFKEVPAPDNEDFTFDFGLEMPGKDFEIWYHVKSTKQDWDSYEHTVNTPNAVQENPDSLYNTFGAAQAKTFEGDKNYIIRNIPKNILARYNADAGKTYLLTLLDLPETKSYKYALLITLQKFHTGIIMAVCFTNEKGPEFFKNIDKASNSLKFKNVPAQQQ